MGAKVSPSAPRRLASASWVRSAPTKRLRRPNAALQGATPLSLLRTGSGAELVEQVLGRIAYGVFS